MQLSDEQRRKVIDHGMECYERAYLWMAKRGFVPESYEDWQTVVAMGNSIMNHVEAYQTDWMQVEESRDTYPCDDYAVVMEGGESEH